MKVLVVESDPDIRALIRAVIGGTHSVQTLECGSAALVELRTSPPDLLLAELSLCGASGEDLARAAAALPQPPRVVLMSADHPRLERSGSLSQARIQKPFAVSDLVDALGTEY